MEYNKILFNNNISKNIFLYILKKLGPTEIRTRIKRFRVFCANRYTIEPSCLFVQELFYKFINNIHIIEY